MDKQITKTDGKNEIQAVKENPDLYNAYKQNADLGAENLGGALPLLKVHLAGRSSKNKLADGSDPDDGAFFYGPTRQQFSELEVHILAISKGFRTDGLNRQNVFNQLMTGVIISDGDYKPFVMFLTGKKLAPMWAFGKEARRYTQKGIPLFTLTVKLTTKSESNDFGKSWIVEFEIVSDKDGTPTLIHDLQEFNYLKDKVEEMKEVMDSIIGNKSGEDQVEEAVVEDVYKEEEEVKIEPEAEEANPDDINF